MHEQYSMEIQQRGYTVIPQVFSPSEAKNLKQMIVQEYEKNQSASLNQEVPRLNQGHQIVYNLQNKNIHFFQLFTRTPILLKILIECLNDQWYKQIPQENPNFILRSLLARSSGNSAMPLHIDSFIPNPGNFISIIQTAIVLEDQNKENGCTLVVPGSHHFGRDATQDWIKYTVPVESKAGDVVMWDSRLWHGASANQTTQTRWSVIATFCRWWIKQNYDITGAVPDAQLAKLSDMEKAVLGFCSLPPRDEYDRLDIKTGYEVLQKC